MMATPMSLSTSHSTVPPQFTPLEQELLQEYTKLVSNMNIVSPLSTYNWSRRVANGQVSTLIADMAGQPTSRILEALRSLERKTGLVFTFFKASVYAMVMNKPDDDDEVLREMELNGQLDG